MKNEIILKDTKGKETNNEVLDEKFESISRFLYALSDKTRNSKIWN